MLDRVIATVILDGLLHHSYVLNIRGESYCKWLKRQSGLLALQRLLSAGIEEKRETYLWDIPTPGEERTDC